MIDYQSNSCENLAKSVRISNNISLDFNLNDQTFEKQPHN